jgi:uncharacterized SAM-binding protein YcdF (DUF218 family)
MSNLASKLLSHLFDPLTLALLLSVCALLAWKRRRLAVRLLIVAIALLLVFTSRVVSNALVRSLEDQYHDSGLNVPPAPAIVVLGGTIHMPSGTHHLTQLTDPSDRLLVAFRLYRAGKAPLILCTGGLNPLAGQTGKTPEATWMARLLEEWNIPPTAIQIEGGSINTHENAIRSYEVLAPQGIHRILLVTSAMHMPRAAGAFRKAGFEVVAVPADFHSGWRDPDILSRWFPSADNLRDSYTALHEWLGIATYRLRGWI